MDQNKVLQYRQIDFLRLFKLCRELGVIQRKRKMPTQYDGQNYASLAISKLFKSFLTETFEDLQINAEARLHSYSINIPHETSEKLRFINNRFQTLNVHENYADILTRFTTLMDVSNFNFIISPRDYNFTLLKITAMPNVGGRFQSIVANMESRVYVSRPREEYYRAAKDCLAYKAVWNEHIGHLCEFVDRERENIERRAQEEQDRLRLAEQERIRQRQELRRAEEQRAREEYQRTRAEEQRAHEEHQRREVARRAAQAERVVVQAQQIREQQRSRAQELFNQALAARQGR